MNMSNWVGEKLTKSQPYTKNYQHLSRAGRGDMVLLQGRVNNLFQSNKWTSLRTYIPVTFYGLSRLIIFRDVYMYAYICTVTIKAKCGHEFERQ